MGVNTTTPVITGELHRLITPNSFRKFSSATATDIAGTTKPVSIHDDFYEKMLVHTAFLLHHHIFCGILIPLIL